MVLRKTVHSEIPELTRISKAAFDTDNLVGNPETGGPPDYDSESWHAKMMECGNLYTAIDQNTIIGGAVLFTNVEQKELYIGRIFIDPVHFQKGYGITIMEQIARIAGDNFIGGEDFTDVLYNLFLQNAGIAPETLDLKTRSEVRKNAENCKCAFSHSNEIIMCCTIQGQMHILRLTLEEYERACAPLLDRLRKPIERSLRDAGVSLKEIDQIVLVGGATRSPVVRKFVARLFGRTPSVGINPDEAVAIGAALQCGMKSRDKEIQEVVLTDVCPFTLGTEVMVDNGVFEEPGHYLPIIERNTVIPVSRTETVYS